MPYSAHFKLLAAVLLVCSSVAGQTVTAAFHPGGTLMVRGADFVKDKATAQFSGPGQPTAIASWVSSDQKAATFQIPPGATSGTVTISPGGGPPATIQVEIIPVDNVTANALKRLFDHLQGNSLLYLVALAGLGVLTMSVIQAIKNLFPVIRRKFQRNFTMKWLVKHAELAKTQFPEFQDRADATKAAAQMLRLGADGDEKAFYNSEADDFYKQLSAVAQLVVDYPASYPELFTVMAANSDPADYLLLMRGNAPPGGHTQAHAENAGEEHPKKTVHVSGAAHPSAHNQPHAADALSPDDLAKEQLNAKNRVRQLVIQSTNAFQLRMGWQWGAGLRVSSFCVSFGLVFIALRTSGSTMDVPATIISSAIAAFIAPVARDLVAAIEKLRS